MAPILICFADTPAAVEAAAVCGVLQITTPIIARLDDPSTATARQARFLRKVPMAIPPSFDCAASQSSLRLDQMYLRVGVAPDGRERRGEDASRRARSQKQDGLRHGRAPPRWPVGRER